MAILSQKLHYQRSNGESGECNIYDNQTECPNPSLKININGKNGFIKLSSNLSDPDATPLRVYENASGITFAVLRTAIPTGAYNTSFWYGNSHNRFSVTIPAKITVVRVFAGPNNGDKGNRAAIVYNIDKKIAEGEYLEWMRQIIGNGGGTGEKYIGVTPGKTYNLDANFGGNYNIPLSIQWSSAINAHAVDVQDY